MVINFHSNPILRLRVILLFHVPRRPSLVRSQVIWVDQVFVTPKVTRLTGNSYNPNPNFNVTEMNVSAF